MDWLTNKYLIVNGIILLATLAHSITRFGFSIVAMSFLRVVGLRTSVPLVTLVTIVGNIVVWYYYRRDSNVTSSQHQLQAIWCDAPLDSRLGFTGYFLFQGLSPTI